VLLPQLASSQGSVTRDRQIQSRAPRTVNEGTFCMRFPRICSRAVPVRGRPANLVVDPYKMVAGSHDRCGVSHTVNVEKEITLLLLSSFLNYYFKLYLSLILFKILVQIYKIISHDLIFSDKINHNKIYDAFKKIK
jgi:hypothetical protein